YSNDMIVNTNLLLTFTEYYNYDNQFSKDGDNPSLFEDDDSPSPLFEDGSNSSYDINFNTSRNYFDDRPSVDRFIHNYCRNDKNLNDASIIYHKSFHCSSSNPYEPRKVINYNSHRIWSTTKTDCEWYCNFTFSKTAHKVKCTTLKDIHNHE
ncbi:476_t:CDS:2, partial [Gigaspora rosea]